MFYCLLLSVVCRAAHGYTFTQTQFRHMLGDCVVLEYRRMKIISGFSHVADPLEAGVRYVKRR
jgi:hypothetical protein